MEEKQFEIQGPDVIQLERRGDYFYNVGGSFRRNFLTSKEISDVKFDGDVYVGLFVCAHNKDVVEKADFENVRIVVPASKDLVPYRKLSRVAILREMDVHDRKTKNFLF